MILRPESETNGGGVLPELRGRSGARSITVVFCFVFFLSYVVLQKEKTIKVETLDCDSQAIQWEDKQWEYSQSNN